MYPILTAEQLTEMRSQNNKKLGINKEITAIRRRSLAEKKHFLSENPLIDIYSDFFTDGCIIEYPYGLVMTHSDTCFYYRGQSKDHKTCYSSLFRKINKCSNEDEKTRKKFISQLKINEFGYLLLNLIQVKEWPFGTVFPDAIAQHYGFDTGIIDFTNDLDVALFFACCKHIGNNRYSPLTEEDIKWNKYGLLFRRDVLVNNICLLRNFDSAILPIGYQPFTRCNRQRGFFIRNESGEDIQVNSDFTIFRIEHSLDLSKELYCKYDEGKKLFNYDALDDISKLLEKIKTANTFSNESFEATYMQMGGSFTKDEWKTNLKENEKVSIGESSYILSKECIDAINKKWSVEKFIEDEGIAPGFRKQL